MSKRVTMSFMLLTPIFNSAHVPILIVTSGERDHREYGNSRRTLKVFSLMDIIMWRLKALALESCLGC